MTIIKVPSYGLSLSEFGELLDKNGGCHPSKVSLKIKVKKKWKLKKFSYYFSPGHCEYCGNYAELELEKNGKTANFDSHFGPSYITPEFLLATFTKQQ